MSYPIPSPDTPTFWIIDQLKKSVAIQAILGATGDSMPIFESGWVPSDEEQPPVFLVVRPPEELDLRLYGETWPTAMQGRFIVWAETRSDRIPDDLTVDGVLTPLTTAIFTALAGVDDCAVSNGGKVWSSRISGWYAPKPLKLTEHVKICQKGVVLTIQAG
jgi:hypothetical protein